jgi:hypothetical protein
MIDGLRRTWLNWRKSCGWLRKRSKGSHHRTRPRVENAPKLPAADQKSCKMFLGMVQLRALRSGSSGETVVMVEGGDVAMH